LASFFGFGLLLALTPCVFPMIPILSGIIVGQKGTMTTKKALIMSIVFVLSMSVTYSIAGVLAGYFGENLQVLTETHKVLMPAISQNQKNSPTQAIYYLVAIKR
jgi:thiol:disulfide interchange protein DsbD